MAIPVAALVGATLTAAGRYAVKKGAKKAIQKYGDEAFNFIKKELKLKTIGDKVVKRRMTPKENKALSKKIKAEDFPKATKGDKSYEFPTRFNPTKGSKARSAETKKVQARERRLKEEQDKLDNILDVDNPPKPEVPLRFDLNKGGLLDDDKTRIGELKDIIVQSPQRFESKVAEMNYYKKLRDEEFLKDKEAGVPFRELSKLYGDLNKYIKRKKKEEAMGDSIVDPKDKEFKTIKSKKSKKPFVKENTPRASAQRGGLLDDDRMMYKEGGPGIEALRKVAPEVVERMGYQEGGSMDDQMEMAMNMDMEEQPEMIPDEMMENNYTDFIMAEALSEEEEDMLMSKLEQDEELQMLFDKVIDVAQEFAGSGPVEGPGSGVSDSIPARLSDGEFVFTAKATEEIGEDTLMSMMKEAEANADMRQTAQMGGVMDKNNPNALGVQGSILDNREDNYTNPMEQPPIRGAGYGR